MAGYTPRQFTCLQASTCSNRAQSQLTTLIEANALTTTLCHHQCRCRVQNVWNVVRLQLKLTDLVYSFTF